MAKKLYTKKISKHPWRGLVTGVAGLFMCGFLITNWSPEWWGVEAVVLGLGYLSMLVITSWIFKNIKTGWILTTSFIGLLLFSRWGILNLISASLLILVLVLIALVN